MKALVPVVLAGMSIVPAILFVFSTLSRVFRNSNNPTQLLEEDNK